MCRFLILPYGTEAVGGGSSPLTPLVSANPLSVTRCNSTIQCNPLNVTLQCNPYLSSLQILVEESAGKKRPGATQVMSLTLIDTHLHIGPCGPVAAVLAPTDNSRGRPPTAVPVGGASSDCLRVAVSVGDVRLQDLQSCVEHRNVLSATNWRRDDQVSECLT